ncbi:hypothetical protein FACS189431_8450 [Alphaproteobacteria bacterium]|nr:hypothetical protein FACS189431_8450 [Alphaproteobacteria bacterium]
MTATNRSKRIIETDLTPWITSYFHLIKNNFLTLSGMVDFPKYGWLLIH